MIYAAALNMKEKMQQSTSSTNATPSTPSVSPYCCVSSARQYTTIDTHFHSSIALIQSTWLVFLTFILQNHRFTMQQQTNEQMNDDGELQGKWIEELVTNKTRLIIIKIILFNIFISVIYFDIFV
jgi:hypothetical protein